MHKWPPLLYAPSKWTSTKGNRVSRKLNMPSPTQEHKGRASRGSLKGLQQPLPRCQRSRYPSVLAGAHRLDGINYTVRQPINFKGSFLKIAVEGDKSCLQTAFKSLRSRKFGGLVNQQQEATHQMTKWPCPFLRICDFLRVSRSPPWGTMSHLPGFSVSAFSRWGGVQTQ